MCALLFCLGPTDKIETEMDSRRLDSDSRIVLTCDGSHDHIRTWIQAFKYFVESS